MQTLLRSKNKDKTEIDYDLNIFMREVQDPYTGEYYYDPTSWMIHVYECNSGSHREVEDPRALTVQEIRALGLNNDSYFEDGDSWYGMKGYLQDYWHVMPDSIKMYLESFPKYK